MGAGRKTSTYEYDHKGAQMYAVQGFEARQRNLGEALGGCIFGCTNDTMAECLGDLVFGLPRAHWCYVQWISKDSPIFLYNYTTRQLHGIFRAETDGTYDLKPDGWCKGSNGPTPYPCQVKVSNYCECQPLTDREYKPIIKDCIVEDGRLLFELKRQEAQALCRAFDEKTNGRRSQAKPMPNATGADTQMAKDQKKPFRAASPPATPAWSAPKPDNTANATAASTKPAQTANGNAQAAPRRQAEPPKADDFPSLPGAAPATSKASSGWGVPQSQASGKGDWGSPTSHNQTGMGEWEIAVRSETSDKGEWSTATAEDTGPAKEKLAFPEPANATASESSKAKRKAQASQPSKPAGEHTATPVQTSKSPKSDQPSANSRPVSESVPEAVPPQPKRSIPEDLRQNDAAPATPMEVEEQAASTSNQIQASEAKLRTADSFSNDYTALLSTMHASLQGIDQTAADSVWHVFKMVKDALDQGIRDRFKLAQVCDAFRRDKNALTDLAIQQSLTIDVLKEEAAALRRDLAFVGEQINVTVTPVNTFLEELPPLPVLPDADYPETSGHNLGVSPASETLFIMGGTNSKGWTDNIDTFNPTTKQWVQLGIMPKRAGYWAASSLPGHIYLVGGGDGRSWSNTCLRYDLPQNEWFEMAPLGHERGSLASATLDGKVYAIGGGTSGVQLNTVELLDPTVNTWMLAKSLHAMRFAPAASVLGNAIYVFGGFDGKAYLSSAESYDPREGRWKQLPECRNKRGGHNAVTVGEEIWTLGGWDNVVFQDTAEVYDSRASRWRKGASMKTAHAYFAAAHLHGELFALGGMSERTTFNELVERYDAKADRWKAFQIEPSEDECGRRRAFAAFCRYDL